MRLWWPLPRFTFSASSELRRSRTPSWRSTHPAAASFGVRSEVHPHFRGRLPGGENDGSDRLHLGYQRNFCGFGVGVGGSRVKRFGPRVVDESLAATAVQVEQQLT